MSGIKKFSMFTIAAVTAAINAFFADPAQAESLVELVTQFLPTILVFAGSFFGVSREVKIDLEREKTKQAQANNTPVKQQIQTLVDEIEIISNQSYEPFDVEEFAGIDYKKLKNKAAQTYLSITPITVFFSAQDKGKATPCRHIDQALAYWDFCLSLSLEAFDFLYGFKYDEAATHLADSNPICPYYSVDNMARQKGIHYWTMLKNVRWTIKKQHEIDVLAASDINWQSKLEKKDHTLYSLGFLSGELLKYG